MSIELKDDGLLQTKAFIGGEWKDSNDGTTFEVTNPATNEVIAEVARCGTDETRRAIECAEDAMAGWRAFRLVWRIWTRNLGACTGLTC